MTTKNIPKKKLMAALNSRIMDIGFAFVNIALLYSMRERSTIFKRWIILDSQSMVAVSPIESC